MSSHYGRHTSSSPRSTANSSRSPHPSNSSKASLNSQLSQHSSLGLPSEEYHILRRRQERNRLESHFAHTSSSNTAAHRPTAYQNADLSPADRVRISQIKNATRHALDSSFDFTDESYERSQAATSRRTADERQERSKYKEPIPQRYIDEFNKMWAEDDDIYDSKQARTDYMPYAPWRMHADMPRGTAPVKTFVPSNRASQADKAVSGASKRRETRVLEEERPSPPSRFSTDSLSKPRTIRSMFGHRH